MTICVSVGGTGNDTVISGTGDDIIYDDGTTDDILSTISTITGGLGNDSVVGGLGNDSIIGGLSNDDINRLNNTYLNNDTVIGGLGNDSIIGGTGNDVIYDDGTTGSILDTISTITGGTGNDSVIGALGNDVINDLNDKYDVGSGPYDYIGAVRSDFDTVDRGIGDGAYGYDAFGGNADDFGKYGLGVSEFGGGYGGGGGGKYLDMYDVAAYAKGGPVKTHYQTAGRVQLPSGYDSPESEADWMSRWESQRVPVQTSPVDMTSPPPPVMFSPAEVEPAPVKAPLTAVALNNARNASMPDAPAVVAAPKLPPAAPPAFGSERMGNIQALLAAYGPKDGAYGEELKAARATSKAESEAFAKLLSDSMKSPEDAQSSKAEMYFRLAAAFGAPTKTGHFAENLGMVGKELGDYSKEQRASRQQKLALALKGQEMKMGAAKDDLRTLQALSAEEMKDKRTIATELIKDYIKSGEPQSTAGKQALDEGLKPGTPEYQKRVEQIGNMNIEGKLAQITASLANMGTAQANLALAQEKFQNQKEQQTKLSSGELKLKTETEETLAQTDQAIANLKKAYALNPNTFDTSLVDVAQRKLLEAGGSKDPKVAATREMENLLEKAALSQLKSTFPGAISNDERKALQDVQGLGAKSKEERASIMKNGYAALKSVSERHRKRLNEINSGVYRNTASTIDGGNE